MSSVVTGLHSLFTQLCLSLSGLGEQMAPSTEYIRPSPVVCPCPSCQEPLQQVIYPGYLETTLSPVSFMVGKVLWKVNKD